MAILRRVQGRDRVRKRAARSTQPKREPRALVGPELDQERLATRTYLTVVEAMAYIGGFRTQHAFRVWVTRRGIPKCRAAGLRFLRRDLDEAVQPPRKGSHKEQSALAGTARHPRSLAVQRNCGGSR